MNCLISNHFYIEDYEHIENRIHPDHTIESQSSSNKSPSHTVLKQSNHRCNCTWLDALSTLTTSCYPSMYCRHWQHPSMYCRQWQHPAIHRCIADIDNIHRCIADIDNIHRCIADNDNILLSINTLPIFTTSCYSSMNCRPWQHPTIHQCIADIHNILLSINVVPTRQHPAIHQCIADIDNILLFIHELPTLTASCYPSVYYRHWQHSAIHQCSVDIHRSKQHCRVSLVVREWLSIEICVCKECSDYNYICGAAC